MGREKVKVDHVLIALSYKLQKREVGDACNANLRSCDIHRLRRSAQRDGIERTRGDHGVISHIYERLASARGARPRAHFADVPAAVGEGSEETVSSWPRERDDVDVTGDPRVGAGL